MSWKVTIDSHDDASPPGENHARLLEWTADCQLLSVAVEDALEAAFLIHEQPGTRQFQITVSPCE